MSKAYDRVEWDFLEGIMVQMGFVEKWISLVMACVKSVSYSVLLNREPRGLIYPSRGIRQGDPLSPYLFLICAEGLSSLLRKADMDKTIHGVSVCRGGLKVSHLLFADDSLIFCEASRQECDRLGTLLDLYESALNGKSTKKSLFFSKKTLPIIRIEI